MTLLDEILEQHAATTKPKPDLVDRTVAAWRTMQRESRAAWKAAEHNRFNANWSAVNENINAALGRELSIIRARSRWLNRNNMWAKAAQTTLRNYVIGTGFSLRMQVYGMQPDASGQMVKVVRTSYNDMIVRLFAEWGENCCVHGNETNPFTWFDVQDCMFNRWFEDGECFVEMRLNKGRDVVPLELQFHDADSLDTFRVRGNDKNPVHLGVEYDPDTYQPLAYWIYRPSEDPLRTPTMKSVRIPAENMVHLFYRAHPHQLRGLPWSAAVAQRYFDLDDYDNALLIRSKIAAFFGVIFAGLTGQEGMFSDDSGPDVSDGWPRDGDGNKIANLAPGMIGTVPAGTEVHTVNPTSPEETFEPFTTHHLRGIGAGTEHGLSYVGLTRDTSKTTFAGGRQAENMDSQAYRAVQKKFGERALSPVLRRFIEYGVLSGAVLAPGYYDPIPGPRYWTRHAWMPSGWKRGINPLQEANAAEKDMANYVTTLEDECAARGVDWRDQLDKAAEIEAYKATKGLPAKLGDSTESDPANTESTSDPSTQDPTDAEMATELAEA